jgi:hypothetical protein
LNGFVYIIQAGDDGDVKIGWAVNPPDRLKNLQTGNSLELRLLHFERIGSKRAAGRVERWLHQEFEGHRIRGEWFRFTGSVRYMVRQCTDHGVRLVDQIAAWQPGAELAEDVA